MDNHRGKSIRLGVAGLGTVGTGLLHLVEGHAEAIRTRLGVSVEVTGVSARDATRDRGVSLDGIAWFDDPVALARSSDIDVFVELIGGEEGPARAAVEAAIAAAKPVVTANKALLAHHGTALATQAEAQGVALGFEAAVAGAIPAIKTMREALAGNAVSRVYGILNGTCNYILTTMQADGRSFDDVLAEAQAIGYAEADPTFDVGGFDAAHKLALLSALAFGTQVAFDQIRIEGIEAITPSDIEAADDLGYRIKLLGVAVQTEAGVEQRVQPAMVPKQSAIAQVAGVTNGVAIDADQAGSVLLVGAGAGGAATASAVMSDIADIARGQAMAPFGRPASTLQPYVRAPAGTQQGAYYLRLVVHDRPGVMAGIATHMGERGVSLESIVQRRPRSALPGIGARDETTDVTTLVLITHETREDAVKPALAAIVENGYTAAPPQLIRIEKL